MSKQKLVERQLEQALVEGRWKLFERLPAERQLAEELQVNRNTLRAALSALAARGIVETTHGSGTRVCALPSDHPENSLTDRLYACLLVIPSVVHAASLVIKPSQLLRLERILPLSGTALRNNDAKAFVQTQAQFFTEAVRIINNATVNAAVAACIPDGKSLLRLFASCDFQQNEQVFANLARILGALRHANAQEAESATRDYFATLKEMAEKK